MFFPLVASNILSLSLIFVSFITMCLSVFSAGLSCLELSAQILSLFLFSFWDRYNANVGKCSDLVLEVSEAVFISFLPFSAFSSVAVISLSSGFQAADLFFCLKSSAIDSVQVFLIHLCLLVL